MDIFTIDLNKITICDYEKKNQLENIIDRLIIKEMGLVNMHNKKTLGVLQVYDKLHENKNKFIQYVYNQFQYINDDYINTYFENKILHNIGLYNIAGICWNITYFHSILPEIFIEHINDIKNIDLSKEQTLDNIRNVNTIFFLYKILKLYNSPKYIELYNIYRKGTQYSYNIVDQIVKDTFIIFKEYVELNQLSSIQDPNLQQILVEAKNSINPLDTDKFIEELNKKEVLRNDPNFIKKYKITDPDYTMKKSYKYLLRQFVQITRPYHDKEFKYYVDNFNLLKMNDSSVTSNITTGDYNEIFMEYNIKNILKDDYKSKLYIKYSIDKNRNIIVKNRIGVSFEDINDYTSKFIDNSEEVKLNQQIHMIEANELYKQFTSSYEKIQLSKDEDKMFKNRSYFEKLEYKKDKAIKNFTQSDKQQITIFRRDLIKLKNSLIKVQKKLERDQQLFKLTFINNPRFKINVSKYLYIPTELKEIDMYGRSTYHNINKSDVKIYIDHDNYVDFNDRKVRLRLYSIILHPGGGHYKCVVYRNDKYYLFNDEKVTEYGSDFESVRKHLDRIYGLWYYIE